jgi:hypothetical protein
MTHDQAGIWSAHGLHIAVTLGPMLALAIAATGYDLLVRTGLRDRLRRPSGAVAAAAGLSAVAAIVHGVVCPEHFREAGLYGTFFLVCALAQLGWAVAVLVRPDRRLLALGLAGNVAVLALWALTRTTGIPLGPEAGEVEAVGALDLIASAAELGVVVCAAWALAAGRVLLPSRATA